MATDASTTAAPTSTAAHDAWLVQSPLQSTNLTHPATPVYTPSVTKDMSDNRLLPPILDSSPLYASQEQSREATFDGTR